jgi:uncharacterized phiE125 gp8 family phage protein
MPGLRQITPPDGEPLTLDDLKAHCRIDGTQDDLTLAAYLAAARDLVERHTWRQLLLAEWELTLDEFPDDDGDILLPKPRLIGVTAVTYRDDQGQELELEEGTDFLVDTTREPGRIVLPPNTSWPSTQSGRINCVTVTYEAGYGELDEYDEPPAALPPIILQALRMCVSQWNEHRESAGSLPDAVAALLSGVRFRDRRLARFMEADVC